MITIYSPYQSARQSYIFTTFFKEWLGVDVDIYSSQEDFFAIESPCKLWYAEDAPKDGLLWVFNSGFLNEQSYKKCRVKASGDGEDVVLFPGGGDFGFDVFAAIFYCISRYEEYHSGGRDIHGRFPALSSLAYRMGFLEYPVVDIWRTRFCEKAIERWGENPFTTPAFGFVGSVDVDNATAFVHKGFMRGLLGLLKSIVRRDTHIGKRVKSLMKAANDPYFTYQRQWDIAGDVPYIHFVLCAKMSAHDRSLNPSNPHFQNIIRQMDKNAQVGWHPSYAAFGNTKALAKEKQMLEDILGRSITKSRQHYIRLQFPTTYRQLITLGIAEDYSMGYPEMPGFRAGTSLPFRFFDVEANAETDLKIFSFIWLDTYFSEKKGYTAERAMEEIVILANRVQQYGGLFIPVMHHRSFSELDARWRGWPKVFDSLIKRYAK
jgi:hypothetical protein